MKFNTLMLHPIFLSAGAYRSFQKQQDPLTQLQPIQLAHQGRDNILKGFFAFLVGYSMMRVGVGGLISARNVYECGRGVFGKSFYGLFSAGIATTFYGSLKGGEGMADLKQGLTLCSTYKNLGK